MHNNKRSKNDSIKIKHAIDFIEELSWFLESKSRIKLSEIPELLRNNIDTTSASSVILNQRNAISSNTHYLIGVLPKILQDTIVFPKNDDICNFAEEVLKINVSRKDKRSRYELIGLIVCECDNLNESSLEDLVAAVSQKSNSDMFISEIAKEKDSVGFSWNETIRKMANR